MKKIRNLKKKLKRKTTKKKENYYENNNLKKNTNKIEKRAFTMYWRKFSSDPYSHPHTPAPPDWLKTG